MTTHTPCTAASHRYRTIRYRPSGRSGPYQPSIPLGG